MFTFQHFQFKKQEVEQQSELLDNTQWFTLHLNLMLGKN